MTELGRKFLQPATENAISQTKQFQALTTTVKILIFILTTLVNLIIMMLFLSLKIWEC